jgi:membrane protease subunit HflC
MTLAQAARRPAMNKGIALALCALAILLCLRATCFQVPEGSTAILLRFGSPTRTLDEPGLHFKLPPPIDRVVLVDRRVHLLDPDPSEYLTSDLKNLIIDSFLAWSVEDPLRFFTSVDDRRGAEARLTDVLNAVVGDVFNAIPFAEVVSIREGEEGMQRVVEEITRAASETASTHFGVKVHAARIKRLNFPSQNRRAVFSRMQAEREAIAGEIRSEGLEAYEKIKAAADREEARLMAEADRRARELRGNAAAEATRIYAEAYSRDPELHQLLRSLETVEKAVDKETLLILRSDHELLQVLRTPDLPRRAPERAGSEH